MDYDWFVGRWLLAVGSVIRKNLRTSNFSNQNLLFIAKMKVTVSTGLELRCGDAIKSDTWSLIRNNCFQHYP